MLLPLGIPITTTKESSGEREVMDFAREEMRRAGEEFLKRVSIKVEAVISDVWEH